LRKKLRGHGRSEERENEPLHMYKGTMDKGKKVREGHEGGENKRWVMAVHIVTN